jgi:hypothetical protein
LLVAGDGFGGVFVAVPGFAEGGVAAGGGAVGAWFVVAHGWGMGWKCGREVRVWALGVGGGTLRWRSGLWKPMIIEHICDISSTLRRSMNAFVLLRGRRSVQIREVDCSNCHQFVD